MIWQEDTSVGHRTGSYGRTHQRIFSRDEAWRTSGGGSGGEKGSPVGIALHVEPALILMRDAETEAFVEP